MLILTLSSLDNQMTLEPLFLICKSGIVLLPTS